MEKKTAMQDLTGPQPGETIGFKPLYAQVRERLMRRLVDGEWSPGMLLPSEIELARQLQVSQGTVRKALDSMTADNLLLRRQGRGTYVAEPEESRILFQFFRLSPDEGSPSFPDSKVLSTNQAKPTKTEKAALNLGPEDDVFRIERIRSLSGQPILIETITLPAGRFPSLCRASRACRAARGGAVPATWRAVRYGRAIVAPPPVPGPPVPDLRVPGSRGPKSRLTRGPFRAMVGDGRGRRRRRPVRAMIERAGGRDER